MPKRANRKAYHHGDLRRTLLTAVADLLRTTDPDAISLRDVAAKAGVTSAAPYHHFPDKAHLMAAIAEEGFRELASRERESIVRVADPIARVLALGEAYARFAADRPGHFRAMFRLWVPRDALPSLATAAESSFAPLLETVAEAVEPARVRDVALSAWSTVHGVSTLYLAGPVRDLWPSAPIESLARTALRPLLESIR